MKPNKKDNFMFWAGIGIGLLSGILGNFLVTSSFDIARNGYNILNSSIYLVSLTVLGTLMYLSIKQMRMLNK